MSICRIEGEKCLDKIAKLAHPANKSITCLWYNSKWHQNKYLRSLRTSTAKRREKRWFHLFFSVKEAKKMLLWIMARESTATISFMIFHLLLFFVDINRNESKKKNEHNLFFFIHGLCLLNLERIKCDCNAWKWASKMYLNLCVCFFLSLYSHRSSS